MDAAKPTAARTSGMVWTGRIISGLLVLFLVFTTTFGFLHKAESAKHMAAYGYRESDFVPISIALIVSFLLYAFPRTAIFGAILLTGYLGGATATHVRAGEPFFFPIVVGVLAWIALYLRDERLRTLVPLRR